MLPILYITDEYEMLSDKLNLSSCYAKFPDDERFKLYKVYKKHKSASALTFVFFMAKKLSFCPLVPFQTLDDFLGCD